MTKAELNALIRQKKSFLCIGLDTDLQKIPPHLLNSDDPVFEFNKQIIDATHQFAVAYKPNIAFYESLGATGWQSLEKTIRYLDNFKESIFTIADAKRGDIGNTSERYAKAFLSGEKGGLNFDAITVAPYMGGDSVKPFLSIAEKWVILLALTSNQGAFDFQTQKLETGKQLFETVIETSKTWGSPENMMYVVGATKAEMLADIRKIIPDHFLLVPGVGAQGGSLEEVCKYGINAECGLLVNSSRGIIYTSQGLDFAESAGREALKLQQLMAAELIKAGIC
ncbi:MAG: orotidine-5'-phosphate decarboxylase [Bacteroidales bacterium]|nr:orotidine-5'-phosphate decarboxylase [Bacteroidales bacterium]